MERETLDASDIMVRDVVTIDSESLIAEAVSKMVEHDISGIPVTDKKGNLIGIISESDVLKHGNLIMVPDYLGLLDSMLYSRNPEKYKAEIKKTLRDKVKTAMSRKVFTATEDTPVGEIALRMSNRDINRIVIVDGKKIVGIISRRDITRLILEMAD